MSAWPRHRDGYACDVRLKSGFEELGPLPDKRKADFVDVFGPPVATRELFNGHELVEWRQGRLLQKRVAVLFDQSRRYVGIATTYNLRLPAAADPRTESRAAFDRGRRVGLLTFEGEHAKPRGRRGVWARTSWGRAVTT